LIRATAVLPKGQWSETQGAAALADTVVLHFDDRHRRRIAMTGTRGLEFLLDLPDAVALRGGDALLLDDGRLVEVVAAAEPLIEVRGRTPGDLVRLAWHIGNRHLSAQVMANALRIRGDHVVEEMLRGLGASVVEIEAPFDPEGGAYAAPADATAGHHQHDDGLHDRKHDGKKHAHGHDPAHGHGHENGHKHGRSDHVTPAGAEHKHDYHDGGKHGHKHGPDDKHGHKRDL
jgi:urease accessory protein